MPVPPRAGVSRPDMGRQEVTVVRVVIAELHKDFSKARVREDKGITAGAVLRKAP